MICVSWRQGNIEKKERRLDTASSMIPLTRWNSNEDTFFFNLILAATGYLIERWDPIISSSQSDRKGVVCVHLCVLSHLIHFFLNAND
jgi:hypothetical protein